MRLVQVLAERGLVSQDELGSLLGRSGAGDEQVVSYLVETGAVTTDQLAQALGLITGIPPALDTDFARADPQLRKRLPAHRASALGAIPLYTTNNRRVAVAMVDPTHPRMLDELGFSLGAVVEPMVMSEQAHIRQLELLYGMPTRRTGFRSTVGSPAPEAPGPVRKHRTLELTTPLGGRPPPPPAPRKRPSVASPYEQSRPVPAPPPAAGSWNSAPADPPRRPTLKNVPTAVDMPVFVPETSAPTTEELEAAPTKHDVPKAERPSAPRVSITGPDSAVEQILAAANRQVAADHLFVFMRSCFGAGAMFVVDGIFASGRFGYNLGNPCPGVESLVFSLSMPSCLRDACVSRSLYHGPPALDGESIHRPLWSALRCTPPAEVVVAPVVVADQVPILLYAQARGGLKIDAFTVERFERVAEAVASSLLRLSV